jgi:hypothetical protein
LVVALTGFDYLVASLLTELNENSTLILIILGSLTIIIIALTFRILKTILEKESQEKSQHRKLLLFAFVLTLLGGLSSFLIYLIEIVLSSGFLGTAYFNLDCTSYPNKTDLIYFLMVLIYLLKIILNTSGLVGCIIISIVWTKQFRIWAKFSEASFIKSFYFVGIAMVILYLDQFITVTMDYVNYWFNPQISLANSTGFIRIILTLLFSVAALILPVYIYFLARAGQHIRIPYQEETSKSRLIVILPFIFFILWFWNNMTLLGGESTVDSMIATLITYSLFFAIFIPISIGFFTFGRKTNSKYLKENLYQAAIGTFALSTIRIVYQTQWFGMNVLPGYLLSFSILTWSLANISRYLGSREALSQRLKREGAQFLLELGEAELKAQTLERFTKVMVEVSNGFIEDLTKIPTRTPPSEEEIRNYIVKTMGVEESPSEAQVLEYLEGAIGVKRKFEQTKSIS